VLHSSTLERRKIKIGLNECNSVAVQVGTSPNNAEQDYTMQVFVGCYIRAHFWWTLKRCGKNEIFDFREINGAENRYLDP